MRNILIALFMIIGLAGCANPYVNKYAKADNWVGLAYYDVELGRKARTSENLDELGATTQQAQEDYLAAYKEHVSVYCDPKNAVRAGILGKPYNAVCIDETARGWEYKQNWLQGLEANSF
ncbi:DUF2799 domain-containing protein [Enterovibrio nigricans]|uniref:DUF2799 domain-containing protein n=1 Tax=Enterovibrio nigricans DSM 22720 TaxID=1121868 RepID=A0A1T4UC26_9GAMM|nr:DUF2799 domain-containing protein [Enterovibrio nigricans]PKF51506.1 DUF2799 domain-containing protein [Enterovibrio nigricans]SKA50264.1 Protein of unknown function [Enterovibrio nigricans DSM 22720]